jgi:hypothetical protein
VSSLKQGPMLLFLKYFRRKKSAKNWRFDSTTAI